MTQSLFIRRYSNRFLSRWLVLAIDLLIVMFSFSLSSLLRMNFHYGEIDLYSFQFHFVFLFVIRLSVFLWFKSYTGIIRHTSIEDAVLILKAVFSGTAIAGLFSLSLRYYSGINTLLYVPLSILAIDFFICLCFNKLQIYNFYKLKFTPKTIFLPILLIPSVFKRDKWAKYCLFNKLEAVRNKLNVDFFN